MPDDLSTALAKVRERHARWNSDEQAESFAEWASWVEFSSDDVPRLLAVVDAVLEHHRPRQLYDLVVGYHGKHLCAHDPGYDGDRHFEGDDGLWYCKDKPTLKVCVSCTDEADRDLWAAWPCATYSAVLAALTGEGNSR